MNIEALDVSTFGVRKLRLRLPVLHPNIKYVEYCGVPYASSQTALCIAAIRSSKSNSIFLGAKALRNKRVG